MSTDSDQAHATGRRLYAGFPATMRDVTPLFAAFREVARHLWNTFYRPESHPEGAVTWDERDAFSRVATELFSAMVLEPLEVADKRLTPMWVREGPR